MAPVRELIDRWTAGDPVAPGSAEGRLPGVALVLERWRWVVVAAVVGCLLGSITLQVRPPVYESTVYLLVIGPPTEPAQNFSRTAQAMSRLATAPGIVSFRLRSEGLVEAAEAPRRHLTVRASPDAPLVSITGTAETPEEAKLTAATVADGLSSVQELGPFELDVLTSPTDPDGPATPTWFLPVTATGLGAALALVLAAAIPRRVRRTNRDPGVIPGVDAPANGHHRGTA